MGKSTKRFARNAQRNFTKKKVEKLQRAGLLGDVDFRKPLPKTVIDRLHKYNSLITGKATAVKAPSVKEAARLRKTLGLKGSGRTIVVPKEKKEKYTYQKSTGEIVSTRPGYNQGETIKKTLGPKFVAKPEPGSGKRLYYTIPERTRGSGRLKRKTFSSFDEFLFYLSAYDINFEDIEERLEVEEVRDNSAKDKRLKNKIHDEREKAAKRYKRRNARKKRAKKK